MKYFLVRLTKGPQLAQSLAMKPYLASIRSSLDVSLCLRNLPSQSVSATAQFDVVIAPPLPPLTPGLPAQIERQNRPEIEDGVNKELLLAPITHNRTERECVLIEPSINSTRISVRIKQADELERLLAGMFTRFLAQRAEQFVILRRRPIEGYDLSFLVTHAHLEVMLKARLIDFIITFLEDVDREISALKIAMNARSRLIAGAFTEALARA